MDIVRCSWCGHVDIDDPDSCHCKKCGRNDATKILDGTEELFVIDEVEALWDIFGNIPMNPETECIEDSFLYFPAGTHREDIWEWFDERYEAGVYGLMYQTD